MLPLPGTGLLEHQITANCSHYLRLDKYQASNTAYLIEGGEKKHVTLKHNSQGEKFIQWGFVVVGWMMYSNGTVQLLSFRKQIMGWEMGDAQPETLCLTEVARKRVCVTVSKWELPIYIKYGIFIPGLFAPAEGNTFIWGQWRDVGRKDRRIRRWGRGRYKNEITMEKWQF